MKFISPKRSEKRSTMCDLRPYRLDSKALRHHHIPQIWGIFAEAVSAPHLFAWATTGENHRFWQPIPIIRDSIIRPRNITAMILYYVPSHRVLHGPRNLCEGVQTHLGGGVLGVHASRTVQYTRLGFSPHTAFTMARRLAIWSSSTTSFDLDRSRRRLRITS